MKNDLTNYNKKRDFSKTREPRGSKQINKKKQRFVVQHHYAKKEHYDFRLEYNGVLKSWAVPKGPSYDSNDKRLAIMVEDHPLEYRNFEGTIPKGEYGGGTVIIFDEGNYEPLYSFKKGFEKGHLKFKLLGNRLKGIWNLVHFKDNNWLLIKEKDNEKGFVNISKIKTSIRTNKTKTELESEASKKISVIKNVIEGIEISNLEKIIYTNPKINKQKIIEYYQKVYIRMKPFINDRIISVRRCPSGINSISFFKKHLEDNREGISKIRIENNKNKNNYYYFLKNIKGLINEAQMNTIEFHIWGSKITKLEKPDLMVFDLDPDESVKIKELRKCVKDLKNILDELKLSSYLKTSGGKGYHVIVPISNINWKECSNISKNIAKLMEAKWPKKYTSNNRKSKRKGKIYIDWMRNIKGSTFICPYSLRVNKKATVSMPIFWDELNRVKPDSITLDKALKRLEEKDPWENFYNK